MELRIFMIHFTFLMKKVSQAAFQHIFDSGLLFFDLIRDVLGRVRHICFPGPSLFPRPVSPRRAGAAWQTRGAGGRGLKTLARGFPRCEGSRRRIVPTGGREDGLLLPTLAETVLALSLQGILLLSPRTLHLIELVQAASVSAGNAIRNFLDLRQGFLVASLRGWHPSTDIAALESLGQAWEARLAGNNTFPRFTR